MDLCHNVVKILLRRYMYREELLGPFRSEL